MHLFFVHLSHALYMRVFRLFFSSLIKQDIEASNCIAYRKGFSTLRVCGVLIIRETTYIREVTFFVCANRVQLID